MRSILLSLFLLALTASLHAQTTPDGDIAGFWTGVLTQEAGGYASEYYFVLQIEQMGNFAKGIAKAGVEEVQVEMSFTATRQANGTWHFVESDVLRAQAPPQLEWCYKRYDLRLEFTAAGELLLLGPWWGSTKSSTCIPGAIRLRRGRSRV